MNIQDFLPFVTAVFGGLGTWFVTKSNNKKEVTINDRRQLSQDQYQLISELRDMMTDQKDEIEQLRKEIKDLQTVNVALTIENKELQAKIHSLTRRLDLLNGRK